MRILEALVAVQSTSQAREGSQDLPQHGWSLCSPQARHGALHLANWGQHLPFRSLIPFFHRSLAAGLLPEDLHVNRAISSSRMGIS